MARLMLDICSGLEGASAAMQERGWEVVTIDNDPSFKPTIIADARLWSWNGRRPDLVWCSPPCTEFAKFAMPCWYDPKELPDPDMNIVLGCKRIIDECQPRFWIIENVRGAAPFFAPLLGRPRVYRPYFLWGYFPPLGRVGGWGAKTKKLSSSARAERAKIPYRLSLAIARAIELQHELLEGLDAGKN